MIPSRIHKISELAKSPEKLTQLLGRFVERGESAITRKRELHPYSSPHFTIK